MRFVAVAVPSLATATLAVAPIQYGVGMQNKVLEALACGTAVVATPQATSALATSDGQDLVVGRDAGELAAADQCQMSRHAWTLPRTWCAFGMSQLGAGKSRSVA